MNAFREAHRHALPGPSLDALRPVHTHLGQIVGVERVVEPIPFADPMAMHDRGFASGELGCAMSMIDQAICTLASGAWHLDRAVGKGGGASYDLTALANLRARLGEAASKIEATTSALSDKLAGAR